MASLAARASHRLRSLCRRGFYGMLRQTQAWLAPPVVGGLGGFVGTPRTEAATRLASVGVSSPRSLSDLVAQADIVLTAAGQTLYELAALGRPAVAIQLAENQGPQLRAFVAAGTVVSVGCVSDPEIERLAVRAVLQLAQQPERLLQMSAAGRDLVDGQGAHRVAAAICGWGSTL